MRREIKEITNQFKKTIPNNVLKYFVPNICATIPLVGGTVESHKNPKVTPNTTELKILGGKNIKYIIETPLNK